jgi:hypothetical protein
MPIMLSKTYAAFKAAGVPEAEAQAAAEELASYENRLHSIDNRLGAIDGRLAGLDGRVSKIEAHLAGLDGRVTKIEADLFVLKWMVAGIYGVLTIAGVPSVWLLLRVAAKVGALT